MLVITTREKVPYTDIMALCGFSETASKGILKLIDKRDSRAMGEWHSGSTDTEFDSDSISRNYIELSDIYTLTRLVFINRELKKDLSFKECMHIIHKYTFLEPYLCDDNKTIVCHSYYKSLQDYFRNEPLED